MGDFGFLEHFEQGSGSAYTISGIMSLRSGHWKTRPYSSFQTTIRNDAPYCVDLDFTLGDRLAFQMGNVLHVDQCTGIRRSYDETSPVRIELSIGRDVEEEDPVARATRTLAQIWNFVGIFFGSQDLF
jgi:hypothetical protein